jgi:hypothetical protein
MATATLQRVGRSEASPTIRLRNTPDALEQAIALDSGSEDRHAIGAVFGIMIGIFSAALLLYGAIALFAT